MQRRSFIKNTALCAVVVSTTGYLRFDGDHYVGDCETTTDILGPFYRPNAPVRTDLVIKNVPGQVVVLRGIVRHKDCTPLNNACVEIWHCGADGKYDNTTQEFRYRGKTYSDEKGQYHFRTVVPVPYDTGEGQIRPAHYHMLISAQGYQSLVTQVYFTGDPYLSKDPSSSSPTARKRILEIKNGIHGEKNISFDIALSDKFIADPAVINRLAGTYTGLDEKKEKVKFFNRNNQLWVLAKNAEYNFQYIGNNAFQMYGEETTAHFEILSTGSVKLTHTHVNNKKEKSTWEAVKEN